MLTIIADIHAAPGRIELVKSELLKLVPTTLAEKGCVQYDLHQDNADPAHFTFFENWTSRELWQAHMAAPHLAAWKKATEGAVAKFALYELTRVEA